MGTSQTSSVFISDTSDEEDNKSGLFSHHSSLSCDYQMSPMRRRRTSSILEKEEEEAKAIIFNAYTEKKKFSYVKQRKGSTISCLGYETDDDDIDDVEKHDFGYLKHSESFQSVLNCNFNSNINNNSIVNQNIHLNHRASIANSITTSIYTTSVDSTMTQLFHLRISTDDESFKTILKQPEDTTVEQIINIIQKKYNFGKITIRLENRGCFNFRFLKPNEKIVQLQNQLLKQNGIDDDEFPSAILEKNCPFRFLIHRL